MLQLEALESTLQIDKFIHVTDIIIAAAENTLTESHHNKASMFTEFFKNQHAFDVWSCQLMYNSEAACHDLLEALYEHSQYRNLVKSVILYHPGVKKDFRKFAMLKILQLTSYPGFPLSSIADRYVEFTIPAQFTEISQFTISPNVERDRFNGAWVCIPEKTYIPPFVYRNRYTVQDMRSLKIIANLQQRIVSDKLRSCHLDSAFEPIELWDSWGGQYIELENVDGDEIMKTIQYSCIINEESFTVVNDHRKISIMIVNNARDKYDCRSGTAILQDFEYQRNKALVMGGKNNTPVFQANKYYEEGKCWVTTVTAQRKGRQNYLYHIDCYLDAEDRDTRKGTDNKKSVQSVNRQIEIDWDRYNDMSPKKQRSYTWKTYKAICKIFKKDIKVKYPQGTAAEYTALINEIISQEKLVIS